MSRSDHPAAANAGGRLIMISLIVFIICIGLSRGTNYFVDNEFDAELQSSIDEYVAEDDRDVYDLSRFKRASENGQENGHDDEHIKCKQSSKKSCCGRRNLFKHFGDHNKTLGKACYEEVMQAIKTELLPYDSSSQSLFSCDKYKMTKKVQYCVFECTGKKRGLINSDGSLNIIEFNGYLSNELFTEPWQKEVGDKAMKKCLKEKFAEWPADETGLKCNPTAVQFQHCLWKEYERSCPQSEQKDSKRCNKLRAALKEQSTLKKRS